MIVGIDIGTSYSSICVLRSDGKVEPVKVDTGLSVFGGEYSLPSAVYIENDKFLVGQAAYFNKSKNIQNFKSGFKRELGQEIPYSIGGLSIYPQDLIKHILIHLKERAEQTCGMPITQANITFPVYYSQSQKNLIKKAATLAGLLNVQLLEEPVAAASFYLNSNQIDGDQTILVYDLGGGTFDAALIKYKDKILNVISRPAGIDRCGSIDFDNEIYRSILDIIPHGTMEQLKANPKVYSRFLIYIQEFCVKVKHHLSEDNEFQENIATGYDIIEYCLDRTTFEKLVCKYLDETINIVFALMNNAGIEANAINTVLLVGGGSRMPLVKDKLEHHFGQKVVLCQTPELAIAKGAAMRSEDLDEHSSEFLIYCSTCKKIVRSLDTNCRLCGNRMLIPKHISKDMEKEYLSKLCSFINQVKSDSIIDPKKLINGTVSNYVDSVQFARGVSKKEELKNSFTSHLFLGMDVFLDRCISNEFHIAVIGTIKSGKSTLINAILEEELASTSVTPETATLTKFRHSSIKNYVKVKFYQQNEWVEFWGSIKESGSKIFLEEYNNSKANSLKATLIGKKEIIAEFEDLFELKAFIKKWSSSRSPEHYFVKELEVGLIHFNVPEEVVFIDTPGLDDPIPYRSNITRNYIDRANLVLVCIKADSLTGTELDVIYRVFENTRYNPKKVFILGTQVDSLNSPLKNWPKQRQEWLKYLQGENCFGNATLADNQLLHVSAYLYTCLLKFKKNPLELSEDEEELIETGQLKYKISDINNDDGHKTLVLHTNLGQIRDQLLETPIKNAKKYIVQDIAEKYKLLKLEINDGFEALKKDHEEYIVGLTEGIEKIESLIIQKQGKIETVRKEREEMNSFLNQFMTNCDENLNQLITFIKQKA